MRCCETSARSSGGACLLHADSTVADLHEVLKVAFGWDDMHLNRFEMGSRTMRPKTPARELHDNQRIAYLSLILSQYFQSLIVVLKKSSQ